MGLSKVLLLLLGLVTAGPALAQSLERSRVTVSNFVVLPGIRGLAEGEIRDFGPAESIIDLPLAWPVVAHLEAKTEVVVHGLRFRYRPDVQLAKAVEAVGGDLATLPPGALIACWGDHEWADLKRDNPELTAAQLATKVYSNPKPCLVDSDNDGSFDRAFFSEQKIAADRTSVAISPAPYRIVANEPAREWRLSLAIFAEFMIETLQYYVFQQGAWYPLIQTDLPENAAPAAIRNDPAARKQWNRTHTTSVLGTVYFDSPSFPSTIEFGNGRLTLLKYDRKTKRITVRLDRMPQGFAVKPIPDDGPMMWYYSFRQRKLDD